MRLFVAILPPRRCLDRLADAIATARQGDEPVRWTLPEQWHVSLAFLGAVDAAVVLELRRRLARVARRYAPMELALSGAGAFSSARKARVVWAGVTGDVTALRRLAGSVAAAARRSGIAMEDRRYRPHLTLGRLPEPTDVQTLLARLEAGLAAPSDTSELTWTADRFELVWSRLGQGEGRRSRYETLASWPLGATSREPAGQTDVGDGPPAVGPE